MNAATWIAALSTLVTLLVTVFRFRLEYQKLIRENEKLELENEKLRKEIPSDLTEQPEEPGAKLPSWVVSLATGLLAGGMSFALLYGMYWWRTRPDPPRSGGFIVADFYVPSGWADTGETERLFINWEHHRACPDTESCVMMSYCPNFDDQQDRFNQVAWQYPANNWCDKGAGLDLSEARRLSFRAWGANGGERVTFGAGWLNCDSLRVQKLVTLRDYPTIYEFSLDTQDLRNVVSAFFVTVEEKENADEACITFYIDNIRYEGIEQPKPGRP